jgi:hypothetical protein
VRAPPLFLSTAQNEFAAPLSQQELRRHTLEEMHAELVRDHVRGRIGLVESQVALGGVRSIHLEGGSPVNLVHDIAGSARDAHLTRGRAEPVIDSDAPCGATEDMQRRGPKRRSRAVQLEQRVLCCAGSTVIRQTVERRSWRATGDCAELCQPLDDTPTFTWISCACTGTYFADWLADEG